MRGDTPSPSVPYLENPKSHKQKLRSAYKIPARTHSHAPQWFPLLICRLFESSENSNAGKPVPLHFVIADIIGRSEPIERQRSSEVPRSAGAWFILEKLSCLRISRQAFKASTVSSQELWFVSAPWFLKHLNKLPVYVCFIYQRGLLYPSLWV